MAHDGFRSGDAGCNILRTAILRLLRSPTDCSAGTSGLKNVKVPSLTTLYTNEECQRLGVEATGCEQLAQSRYTAAPWPGIELATSLDRKSDALPLRHHARHPTY